MAHVRTQRMTAMRAMKDEANRTNNQPINQQPNKRHRCRPRGDKGDNGDKGNDSDKDRRNKGTGNTKQHQCNQSSINPSINQQSINKEPEDSEEPDDSEDSDEEDSAEEVQTINKTNNQ